MSGSEPKCLVCKNPMPLVGTDKKSLTICIDCASSQEVRLKKRLAENLSEEQRKIFEDLINAIDYRSSWIILAS